MASTGGRGKPPFFCCPSWRRVCGFSPTFERGNGSSDHVNGSSIGGERERCLLLTACRSPAGSLEYGLFTKRCAVASNLSGPVQPFGYGLCMRATGRRSISASMSVEIHGRFTAGDVWLSPSNHRRKGAQTWYGSCSNKRRWFADTPSVNCDIMKDMAVRR